MSVITDLFTKSVPYVVGSKTPASLPVSVTLILDKDFKKTIYKTTAIAVTGLFLGMVAGAYIKKKL